MPIAATEWAGEFTANTNLTGVQDQVRTFQLSNGDFWVTWRDLDSTAPADPSGADVLGQRYDPLGNAIGEPVRLNGSFKWDAEQDAEFAASIGTDQFCVTYQRTVVSNGSTYTELVLERHAADGSHLNGAGFTNSIAAGAEVRNPDIAIGGATNGLVVWEQSDNAGNTDIMARFFNPANISYSPIFQVTDVSQADDNFDPEVVALANGSYAVIWTDEYNGSTTDLDLRCKIYSSAGTLVSSFTIAGGLATEHDASIAALSGGGFVVSYTNTSTASGNNGDVLFRMYNASGVAAGAAVTVASGTNAQGKSSVAATTIDGGFVISWSDETSGETLMQSYTSGGTAVGSPVAIVSGATTVEPVALTTLGDGRVLAGYGIAGGGDALAAIYDPRLAVYGDAAYSPTSWIVGTMGNDSFQAAAGAGQIHLMAGDDLVVLHGISPGGVADGGTGTDTLSFADVVGTLQVDLYAETASANGIAMTVTGFENYAASGLAVNQLVFGTSDANSIVTGAGDDTLVGRGGVDTMTGLGGNDTYYVENKNDVVVEADGGGTDTVQASVDYTLSDFVENLVLTDGAIKGVGNAQENTITGNANANFLYGGAGADTLIGGAGNDTYYVENVGDVVTENSGEGGDTVSSSVSFTLGANIERLVLTGAAAINGTGNGLANNLSGNGAANILDGGAGADLMKGAGGNDTYYVDHAGDVVEEAGGNGTDTVYASVDYSVAGQNIENLILTGAAIKGTGNGLANTITGNANANVLYGGGGADTLIGGMGNDTYYVDGMDDVVTEAAGEGNDTVSSAGTYTLGANVEVLRLSGTADINGTGNALANTITGNTNNNVIDGGAGADTMKGGAGNDTYKVDDAGDAIVELAGEGTDIVESFVSFAVAGQYIEVVKLMGSADLNATGGGQADTLFGNSGANGLSGGGGNDVLHGGGGIDTLTGGAGADHYWFETALGAGNVDAIADFVAADDTIHLDRSIFTGIAANGVLAAGAFHEGSVAADAGDRILYDQATGKIYYDADGTGVAAAVEFAQVAIGTMLTNADFFGEP